HVGNQGHESRALHGVARRALERRAIAAPLAGEHLALVGAKLLQQADVLVIDVRRTRAAFRGAEPTTILPVTTKTFPRHKSGVLGRTPKSPANRGHRHEIGRFEWRISQAKKKGSERQGLMDRNDILTSLRPSCHALSIARNPGNARYEP